MGRCQWTFRESKRRHRRRHRRRRRRSRRRRRPRTSTSGEHATRPLLDMNIIYMDLSFNIAYFFFYILRFYTGLRNFNSIVFFRFFPYPS